MNRLSGPAGRCAGLLLAGSLLFGFYPAGSRAESGIARINRQLGRGINHDSLPPAMAQPPVAEQGTPRP